ncbi:hypothetical protein Tco_0633844 [Tanacetum coccineum]
MEKSRTEKESVKTSKALKEIFLEFKDVSHDFIPDERCVWIDLVGLPLASWAPEVYKKLGGRWGSSVFTDMFCILGGSILNDKVTFESRNPLERKDARGSSLDEKFRKMSGFCREEDVRGVGTLIFGTPLNQGEICDDSGLGDCGNVTTDDNEDVTPVIAPEKDSIIAPPSTPSGNDLNIAAETPWKYSRVVRSRAINVRGKDYFSSDLQIWSYYGNVKEAILLHNALSRQTKDAG